MTEEPEDDLAALMRLAVDGDPNAVRLFFESLLNATLTVPTRKQAHNLSDSPSYPNELLNILGMQGKQNVFVPVFSTPSMVSEWCGTELNVRALKFDELVGLIPEDWWICVNPGQEVEKEISPWEISELKHGAPGLAAVLEDIAAQTSESNPEIHPLSDDDLEKLQSVIDTFGADHQEVEAIYGVREERKPLDGEITMRILLAFKAAGNKDRIELLNEQLSSLASKAMIGDTFVKVVPANAPGQAFLHNVLKNYGPLYERPTWLSRFLKMLRNP